MSIISELFVGDIQVDFLVAITLPARWLLTFLSRDPVYPWNGSASESCVVVLIAYKQPWLANRPFSLNVLFSHFRACDVPRENCFVQTSSCPRAWCAYVCLTYERRNLRQIPLENITCSEKEKQNIQAKKVHKAMSTLNRISLKPPHIF